MSGHGAPNLEANGAGMQVTIVAASWHDEIMDALVAGARRALAAAAVSEVRVVRVPGSMELPIAALHAAKKADAVVALGIVLRGGTPHFDYVCQGATAGLIDVQLRTGTPVGFGLLTCDTEEQALDRCGLPGSSEDKGAEAAMAAVATARIIRGL